MRAFRLAPMRHPPFDGEGARRFGGRWNSVGVPVVYLSEHLSLAVLEALVHQDRRHLAEDLVAYEIEIAAEQAEQIGDVPAGWFSDPLRRQPRRFGDAWAAGLRSFGLRVPSAVIPSEWNLLLNPRHPDAGELQIVKEAPFALDARLRP